MHPKSYRYLGMNFPLRSNRYGQMWYQAPPGYAGAGIPFRGHNGIPIMNHSPPPRPYSRSNAMQKSRPKPSLWKRLFKPRTAVTRRTVTRPSSRRRSFW